MSKGPMCRACHVERFFERVLYAPLGFRLVPWQRQVLREIYGTAEMETGRRRYEHAYIEVPKKNGKSFLVGGLPLYHLVMEVDHVGIPKAYGAAAAKDQAGLVYEAAQRLCNSNAELLKHLKVLPSTKRIVRRDGRGFYAVISADGDLQDGIEPSLAIYDEFHRWRTARARTLHDVLSAGMISRTEPLGIKITTAGDVYDSPLCWIEHERTRQLLEGSLKSDRFYGRMWGADATKLKADPTYWKTRAARAEANPSHEDNGGFLRDEAIQAMEEELGEPAYRRYHLNVWNQKAEKLIPMDAWTRCAQPTRPLLGRPCWLGLDLSETTAMTSLVALFPDDDGTYDVLPFFWLPEDRVHAIERRVKVNLQHWIKKGLLETTPGPTLEYEAVRKKIHWLREDFQVQQICYDPWNAKEFVKKLSDEGFLCVEVSQRIPMLSGPTKWLIDQILLGKLRHGGHEVLTWNADCATARVDANGNVAPTKEKLEAEGKRIDGISALLNACQQVMLRTAEDPYSRGAKLWAV